MELLIKSIFNLAGNDYSFLTSFFVVIFASHLFVLNFSKNYRSPKVAFVTFMIMVYCGLYQSGSLRWEYMQYSDNILSFDTNLWVGIDILCFFLLFNYLWSINVIMMRRRGFLKHKHLTKYLRA